MEVEQEKERKTERERRRRRRRIRSFGVGEDREVKKGREGGRRRIPHPS